MGNNTTAGKQSSVSVYRKVIEGYKESLSDILKERSGAKSLPMEIISKPLSSSGPRLVRVLQGVYSRESASPFPIISI